MPGTDCGSRDPGSSALLTDLYDTEAAATKLVQLAPKLAAAGIQVRAVRLDSGDLADHAFKVRKILDDGGLQVIEIFASSGVDEYALHELLAVKHAPIDGFGLGSAIDTSQDAPNLDCAYKLQLTPASPYPVHVSDGIRALAVEVDRRQAGAPA